MKPEEMSEAQLAEDLREIGDRCDDEADRLVLHWLAYCLDNPKAAFRLVLEPRPEGGEI